MNLQRWVFQSPAVIVQADPNKAQSEFFFMPSNVRDTIVKLVLISFVVGLLISFFEINPA